MKRKKSAVRVDKMNELYKRERRCMTLSKRIALLLSDPMIRNRALVRVALEEAKDKVETAIYYLYDEWTELL